MATLIKTRLRSEAGFAVPTVMLMMIAALAIASAVAFSSISAQHGTVRDQRSKLGIASAESGVSEAMSRYNSVATNNSQPCLVVSGGTIVGSGPGVGWCSPVSGTSNGGSYSYQVRPTVDPTTQLTSKIEIVSTGTVGGVTRRVEVVADSASGTKIFCPTGTDCRGVQTQNGINLNSNAELLSGSATNGSITVASNAKICGAASVGYGQTLTLADNAAHYSDASCTQPTSSYTQQPLSLPPVNQGDAATNNDNQRITNAKAGSGTPADLISGNASNVSWDSSTRQLSISSNTALTLTGSKYSLCTLTMSSNTALYVATSQSASIFFDSPEACGLPNASTQLSIASSASISGSSGNPTTVALYFVGSPSLQTWINFASNTQADQACESNFVIYAPRTDVLMNSNSIYCGALAAKSLQMDSNAKFRTDNASQNFTLAPTGSHFSVSRFTECSATPPAGNTNPDGGC